MDKFFVKEIYIRNRAPFEEIHLRFNKDDIYLIAGVNGKGKTTLLSHIVDGLYEMTRRHFPSSYKEIKDYF